MEVLVQGRNPFLAGHIWSKYFCKFADSSLASAQDCVEIPADSTPLLTCRKAAQLGLVLAIPSSSWLCLDASTRSTRDRFQLGLWFCLGPPSTVPMNGYMAMTGKLFVRQALLCTHWHVLITHCTYATTQLSKNWMPKPHLWMTPPPPPWGPYSFPKDKMITMTFSHSWHGPNSKQKSHYWLHIPATSFKQIVPAGFI